jgi:hypothetical protein
VSRLSDQVIADLDPGIRAVVTLVRAHGFETTDSGDGMSKAADYDCRLDFPHVFCVVSPERLIAEVQRLKSLMPDWTVEGSHKAGEPNAILALYREKP